MDAQIQVRGQIGTVMCFLLDTLICIGVLKCGEKAGPYLSKPKPLFLAFGNFEKFCFLNFNKKVSPYPFAKEGTSCFASHGMRSGMLCLNCCSLHCSLER